MRSMNRRLAKMWHFSCICFPKYRAWPPYMDINCTTPLQSRSKFDLKQVTDLCCPETMGQNLLSCFSLLLTCSPGWSTNCCHQNLFNICSFCGSEIEICNLECRFWEGNCGRKREWLAVIKWGHKVSFQCQPDCSHDSRQIMQLRRTKYTNSNTDKYKYK